MDFMLGVPGEMRCTHSTSKGNTCSRVQGRFVPIVGIEGSSLLSVCMCVLTEDGSFPK